MNGPSSPVAKRARLDQTERKEEPNNLNGSPVIVGPSIIASCSHHQRQELCTTRAKYRAGKRETAVKVFTIADESVYLLVHNVPLLNGVNVRADLKAICRRFGAVSRIEAIRYETVPAFTQVFLVKYERFTDAIRAKKAIDDRVLLGSALHVCYAPEFESVEDTTAKIDARQRYVRIKMAQMKNLISKEASKSYVTK